MLYVSDLTKSFGPQSVFESTGFVMGSGERIGLVGRNGSGKTTLFKILLGQEHADDGTVSMPAGYRVGHLEQHLRFTEPAVLDEARLGLPIDEDGRDLTYKAEAILFGLGFTKAMLAMDPLELSGGYQVRLNLAKVLASEPNLLLLDEPTNYLDIVSIRWLARFLTAWKGELILITHDRDFMDMAVTHTMAIHRSKFIKSAGGTGKLYDQILKEEEHHEKTRLNDEKRRKDIERFITRFRAQANRAKAVQSRIKLLGHAPKLERLSSEKDLDFSFKPLPFDGKRMAEIKGLSFGFDPEGPRLFDALSLTVYPGDRIGVIGRNGAGKTTLLNLIAGQLTPIDGEVAFHPKTVTGYFGQTHIDRLNPDKTIEETIHDVNPSLSHTEVRGLAGAMMFEGDGALKKVRVLSGGERSRVQLGTVLAHPANMLLLDEPTNHLDMQSVDSLIEAVDEFPGAVLIVTHSEMVLRALASRLVVFDSGGARVYEGPYQEFLERVGWSSELSSAGGPSGAVRAEPKAAPSREARREDRRARAELIDARSKTLGPLLKRIRSIEEEIMSLEAGVARATEALLEASRTGNAAAIAEHSKAMKEGQDRISALFDELASVSDEHDARAREYSALIDGPAQGDKV